MLRKSVWAVMIMAMMSMAFSWGKSDKKNEDRSVKQKAAADDSAKNIPGAPLLSNEAPAKIPSTVTTVASLPETKSQLPNDILQIASLPNQKAPGVDVPIPAAVSLASDNSEILRIQKQIQEITALNDSLKQRYKDQAAEIQRIADQAKIHQKILTDIEQKNVAEAQVSNLSDETAVAQEKIKMISKDTQEKRQLFEDLQKGNTAPAKTGLDAPRSASDKPAASKVG